LCTLWQRFGRAARGAGREAKAILFVEKKDTDEERALKSERAAQRLAKKNEVTAVTGQKRKVKTQLKSAPSKRPAFGECTNHEERTIVASELRELRRAHYKKRPTAKTTEKETNKALRSEVPWMTILMQQVISTAARIVPMLFFDNDKRRKFISAALPIVSAHASQRKTTISTAIRHCLRGAPVADPKASLSVVTFATRRRFNSSTSRSHPRTSSQANHTSKGSR
jgi:predicted ester cyclase